MSSSLPQSQHVFNLQGSTYNIGDEGSMGDRTNNAPEQPPIRTQSIRETDVLGDVQLVPQRKNISRGDKPPNDTNNFPTYDKQVKSKSDLKMHDLRHKKPFLCTNTSCTWEEGFRTKNDLHRHVKSKCLDATDSIKTYQCQVVGCRSKDKSWPRLDNFKSHLKRLHQLTDEQMNESVEQNSRALDMESLQALHGPEIPLHEELQHADGLPKSQCLNRTGVIVQVQPNERLLDDMDHTCDTRNGQITPTHGGIPSTKPYDGKIDILEETESQLRGALEAWLAEREEVKYSSERTERSLSELLQKIRDDGFSSVRNESPERGRGRVCTTSVQRKVKVKCTMCSFTGRPCELKKHMKRHTRPYGCTFPKCQKTFWSKNDWKRHETSQHYQLETWRCDEDVGGHACAKIFVSANVFKVHLERVHRLPEREVDSKIVESRRRGLNNQARFWCGFCEDIVELPQISVDAWTERFNHIDDHFMGRYGTNKRSIPEWQHPGSASANIIRTSSRELDHGQSRRRPAILSARSSSVTSFTMSDCASKAVSESGIDREVSNHSDTRVYYNMYNMINGQQEEDVAQLKQARGVFGGGSVQEGVIRKLMQGLPSIFNKEWATKIEMQGGNHLPALTDSVPEKRSREFPDDSDKNVITRAPKRLKGDSWNASDDSVSLRLACPFRKHDPRKYTIHSHRSCALSFWDSVARVKEHIYRRHRQPTQCKRCWKLVKDQDELDAHLRAVKICEIEPGEPADGLSATNVARIISRKKTSPNQSEGERWKEIYGVLFPGEPAPTPSFDQVHDDIASSPGSRDLAYYEEYSRRELPNFFRRWLEDAASKETRIDYLRRDLIATVRKCQDAALFAQESKKAPLKISRGTCAEDMDPTPLQDQTTLVMNQSPETSFGNNLEANAAIRDPASFALTGLEKDDIDAIFSSDFSLTKGKQNHLVENKSDETPQTSHYCLGPCVCVNRPRGNPGAELADNHRQPFEDLLNEELPTPEFESLNYSTAFDFLDSDLDWEAMFVDMS